MHSNLSGSTKTVVIERFWLLGQFVISMVFAQATQLLLILYMYSGNNVTL